LRGSKKRNFHGGAWTERRAAELSGAEKALWGEDAKAGLMKVVCAPIQTGLEVYSELEGMIAVHISEILRDLEVPLAVVTDTALKSSGGQQVGNVDGGLEARADRIQAKSSLSKVENTVRGPIAGEQVEESPCTEFDRARDCCGKKTAGLPLGLRQACFVFLSSLNR